MKKAQVSSLSEDEWEALYQDLSGVDGCDLDAEDQEFIADMLARLECHGLDVRVSPRQQRHINRLKEQYQ